MNSLAELRHAVAAIASYDGLTARIAGAPPTRIYRNRDVVITGRTTLSFRVR